MSVRRAALQHALLPNEQTATPLASSLLLVSLGVVCWLINVNVVAFPAVSSPKLDHLKLLDVVVAASGRSRVERFFQAVHVKPSCSSKLLDRVMCWLWQLLCV
ncbi:hypothetical protein VIGAN_07165300 [Vigna angularis var. angularis]|uniref:Uncharacterized protein n=1 Tax=Vigna angularis var. angularis TaxID=157739 RepID=A0A0S3SJ00_PHAAN|nr:hypothetical protein VIGAN_07165300 [Vigna angularis var. angularis]